MDRSNDRCHHTALEDDAESAWHHAVIEISYDTGKDSHVSLLLLVHITNIVIKSYLFIIDCSFRIMPQRYGKIGTRPNIFCIFLVLLLIIADFIAIPLISGHISVIGDLYKTMYVTHNYYVRTFYVIP